MSLDILRKKATEDSGSAEPQIPYLRARSLLPFFYNSLSDKSQQVRSSALLAIQNFGPQGELLFIEGVTKEENPKVKEQCCLGLGRIGVQTFRTLLLTLADSDQSVRDAAVTAILKNMTVQEVLEEFGTKGH